MTGAGLFFAKVGKAKPPIEMSKHRRDAGATPEATRTIGEDNDSVISLSGTSSEKRWASKDKYFYGVTSTYDMLPSGTYRCEVSPNIGTILVKQIIETDNLLELPDSTIEKIISEFEQFWKLEEPFKSRGFLMKRGFLLWGPPGSGKTSGIHILANKLKDLGGIVLFLDNPETAAGCLQMLRNIEPTRKIIAIIEDLDALVERYGENEYLALLDGESQVDNIFFVATTNYPERLDKRFVDRPSRFDTIWNVGMPTEEARRIYFKTKEPTISEEELEVWVKRTEDYSIAHLKEVIIAVKCFGQSLDDVIERLDEMKYVKAKSDGFGGKFGFSRGYDDEDEDDD